MCTSSRPYRWSQLCVRYKTPRGQFRVHFPVCWYAMVLQSSKVLHWSSKDAPLFPEDPRSTTCEIRRFKRQSQVGSEVFHALCHPLAIAKPLNVVYAWRKFLPRRKRWQKHYYNCSDSVCLQRFGPYWTTNEMFHITPPRHFSPRRRGGSGRIPERCGSLVRIHSRTQNSGILTMNVLSEAIFDK